MCRIFDGRNRTFWFAAYEGMRQRQSLVRRRLRSDSADVQWRLQQYLRQQRRADAYLRSADYGRAGHADSSSPATLSRQNRISPFFGVMKSVTHTPTNSSNPFQSPNLDTFYPNNNNTDSLTLKGRSSFLVGG